MRNFSQPGALLRSSRTVTRAVSSSLEQPHIAPSLRPSYSSLVNRSCSPTWLPKRLFSHTAVAAKKKQQPEQKAAKGSPSPTSSSSSSTGKAPKPNPEEPLNLADVEYAFARGTEHFLSELTKARSGGRFNPETLGALRVRPDKKSPETFPLHELAAIVPRQGSRKVSVLVHELAHVKAVMSAIQASPDFNQQPQRVEDNEQELVLMAEAEDPREAAKRLKDILNAWRQQVRDARHVRDQVVKKWRANNTITEDDLHRIAKELQKLQDKKMAEIKAKEKEIEGKSK